MFQFDFHVVEEDVIEEFENHLRESIDIPDGEIMEKNYQPLYVFERGLFFMLDQHGPSCTIEDDSRK